MSNSSPRTSATSVMPAASAVRMASAVGAETANSMIQTVLGLAVYTIVFAFLAHWGYGREEKRTFE